MAARPLSSETQVPPRMASTPDCPSAPPPATRVTIKDVARATGVHFATVSLAMRHHPRISLSTRQRIEAAATRLGYERDPVFQALSARRAHASQRQVRPTIAYLTNQSVENGLLETAHRRRMISGARRHADVMGFGFELLSVDRGAHTSQSLQRHLQKSGIAGLVIGAFRFDRAGLELPWRDYSVVKIDSRHIDVRAPQISDNQMQNVQVAHRELRQLGYRRIGIAVGASDELGTDDLHLSGFHLAQEDIPVAGRTEPLLFPIGTTQTEVVVRLLKTWIRDQRLDAVLCNWTNIRAMIRAAGYACPGEVACACLCLPQPTPGLAGIVANFELVARQAIALLAAQLSIASHGTPPLATHTYVEGHWHHGTSAPQRR